ncbi:MAG: thioredoxin domain-containing protein, partial [Acidimicrobiia bacterium]
FVNVKVDREERPDVDAVYMQAVQTMTGSGGWPMTVFLDADGRPFYGGTYFPPDDRPGMPGFVRLLDAISGAWRERRGELLEQADQLRDAIEQSTSIGTRGPTATVTTAVLDTAVATLRDQFDPRFGGFGRAPKFPQAMTLTFLLDMATRDPDPEIVEMITVSLDAMAAGGLYDQVGGGFHRYSVDAHWLVPHFEKMLYDQALLVRAYLHGWLVTGESRYRRVVEETVGYVMRDLRHAAGGFFSAEDADSEGVEGKFYVWSHVELDELCGDDLPEIVRHFGVTMRGNFEDPHTGYRGNILHAVGRTDVRPEAVDRVLPALFAAREQRVRPGLDDKVLLGWNALFLRSLAEAADAFDRADWMDASRANARFLLTELRRPDGRFLRSWKDGQANLLAYAEDYGALLEALLTLAEVDNVAWLTEARGVADALIALFADDERGGFFTTGADADALIVRPKDYQDNATPSENSLAADALLRLSALTGEDRYASYAERWIRTLGAVLSEHPTAFAFLLEACERLVTRSIEVAIVGEPGDPTTVALRAELGSRLIPASVRVAAAPGVGSDVTPLLADRSGSDGRAVAYVCEHFACQLPVRDPAALREQLDAALAARI